ncbi:MAG: GNAT family N-acetyltransferase [Mucilaginibacter sp.]
MDEIKVRKAHPGDLEILFGFEKGIMVAERPLDPTIQEGDIHYYDLAAMIDAPNVEIVVAELGAEIIGSGYARIETSKIYLKHQKHAYLGFMYVKPAHRGKGVNKKVIDVLQQWALEQNVTEFRLEVYHDNLPAIRAYEKLGFSRLLVEMRMEVQAR